jgi:hypothetical protein
MPPIASNKIFCLDIGTGQNCLKISVVLSYQGKCACQSMVGILKRHLRNIYNFLLRKPIMKNFALLRRITFFVCVLSLCFSLSQCTKRQDSSQITEITMERKGCNGGCPVYKVTFSPDGKATYVGIRNVEHLGEYQGGVYFPKLAAWIESQNFFSLMDKYSEGNLDSEVVITTVVKRGIRKTVTTFNSGAAPLTLWGINTAIDGAIGDVKWAKIK